MHVVSETLLASVSDTTTPQGIVVLAERPRTDGDAFAAKLAGEALPLLVILHGISNPANAGSVLRAAEAAGACGAVAVKNTADLFSPKALRGAMGSSLRLPIWMSPAFADVVAWCNRRELRVICSDTRARQTYTEFDWRERSLSRRR
ncbi:MAG: TrmH family RNA methyltransferase [Pyrinomonadaceae bacterium]